MFSLRPIPWLTLSVFLVCAAFTTAQFFWPEIIPALQRQPSMFDRWELWRLVTSWLIQTDGWAQIVGNFLSLLAAGIIVERLAGRKLWIIAFLAGGLTGNIIGYFWQPIGAGNSIAFYGLAGLLAAWLLGHPVRNPMFRYVLPLAAAASAFVLCLLHDIHGPALIAGLLIGLAVYRVVRQG